MGRWLVSTGVPSERNRQGVLGDLEELYRDRSAGMSVGCKVSIARVGFWLAFAIAGPFSLTGISTPARADEYIPEGYPTEPVEYLAEVAYELCHLPAAERTGLLAHSLHFVRAMGLTAFGLDDGQPLGVPEIPFYAHPEVFEKGE